MRKKLNIKTKNFYDEYEEILGTKGNLTKNKFKM